jgi:hypothetical protein
MHEPKALHAYAGILESLKIRSMAALFAEESAKRTPSGLWRVNLSRHTHGCGDRSSTRNSHEVGIVATIPLPE